MFLLAARAALGGSIGDSVHDFRSKQWNGERICVVCHTPGPSDGSVAAMPQWAFGEPGRSFTLYGNVQATGSRVRPGANSRLCLSCHDGTLATDRSRSAVGADLTAPARDVDSTLANHHPIGIAYQKAIATASGRLFDPAAKTVTIGSGEQARTGTVAALLLTSGRVECLSCHDVHNTFTVERTALLRASPDGRAICVACHDK